MSKLFEFRAGSYKDPITGFVSTNTDGVIEHTAKGLAWGGNGSSSWISAINTLTGIQSVSISFYSKKTIVASSAAQMLFNTDTSANGFWLATGAAVLHCNTAGGAIRSNLTVLHPGWHHFVVIINGALSKIYFDGYDATGTIYTTPVATDFTNLDLGRRSNSTAHLDGKIKNLQLFDHLLSQREIAKLYEEFHRTTATQEMISNNLQYQKPMELSRLDGIVAAYNMIQTNGLLIDISGNGNNAAVTGAVSGIYGMLFDGTDGKAVIGNIGNIKSIAFRIKLDSTTEKIMEGAANAKLIHAASGTLTYPEFDNAFIDGVNSDTIVADKWTNVVISGTNVNFSACSLALNNTTYGRFEIEDLRFYSDEKDLEFAIDYHNSFANRVQTKQPFEFGVGSTI